MTNRATPTATALALAVAALLAGCAASPFGGQKAAENKAAATPAVAAPDAASLPAQAADAVFRHPQLPYAASALEPVIDTDTMNFHYARHHRGYYDNLNRAAAADKKLAALALPQVLAQVSKFPAVVRNNAGGAWNHDFFWASMAPVGQGGQPSARLLAAIERDFGSMEKMQQAFNAAGGGQFGSGWVWLIVKDGKLKVTSTPNQDNPLMDVAAERGTPLLGNDVWEHAYYLRYQNRRADYLKAWWQLVNWNAVNQRLEQALR